MVSDFANFVYSSLPWFVRGGDCDYGSSAGVFNFNNNTGAAPQL